MGNGPFLMPPPPPWLSPPPRRWPLPFLSKGGGDLAWLSPWVSVKTLLRKLAAPERNTESTAVRNFFLFSFLGEWNRGNLAAPGALLAASPTSLPGWWEAEQE